jgi:hypothetical protein
VSRTFPPIRQSRGGSSFSTGRITVIPAIFLLQLLLLLIGITRDYQLKHEDNNALHATFARSHLQLGLAVTRGQNYFYSPATGVGGFYPNHPPGPGLILAVWYGITGHDGPAVTRWIAIAFHVLGTWLFYGLARRVLARRWEVALALLLYVALPESAFFGRMLNHEVLVLPFALLLVRGYWESVHGAWSRRQCMAAMALGALGATFTGWAGFFAIGACGLHAGWEAFVRRNPRAISPFVLLGAGGAVLFALIVAQLLWALGGDVAYLRALLVSRAASGEDRVYAQWLGRILELHWRYFGLASLAGLVAIVVRAVRRKSGAAIDPAQEVALIFLVAGGGYVGTFLFNATKHDYWQFLVLPASALGIVLLVRSVRAATESRHIVRRAVLGLVIVDITLVTTVTLVQRHVKREGYCLETVASLRKNHL